MKLIFKSQGQTTNCIRTAEDALYRNGIYFSTMFVLENVTDENHKK
jgi:hypothetical protein